MEKEIKVLEKEIEEKYKPKCEGAKKHFGGTSCEECFEYNRAVGGIEDIKFLFSGKKHKFN